MLYRRIDALCRDQNSAASLALFFLPADPHTVEIRLWAPPAPTPGRTLRPRQSSVIRWFSCVPFPFPGMPYIPKRVASWRDLGAGILWLALGKPKTFDPVYAREPVMHLCGRAASTTRALAPHLL